jgi:hypothetical protein
MDSLNSISGTIVESSKSALEGLSNVGSSVKSGVTNIWQSNFRKGSDGVGLVDKKEPFKLLERTSRTEVLQLIGGNPWIKVAGICGAVAVGMGAYGAHG